MKNLPWLDPARVAALEAALARRILLLDGAMGTMLQAYHARRGRLPRHALPRRPRLAVRTTTRTAPATSRATTTCCR